MSVSPSPQVNLWMMNRAFNRFAHVVGYSMLGAAGLEVVVYQWSYPSRPIGWALVPIACTLLALVALDRLRTTLAAVIFLVVGTLSLYWFASIFLLAMPSAGASGDIIFSYFAIALIFIGGPSGKVMVAATWCTAAYLLAQTATLLALLHNQSALRLDPTASLVTAGLLIVMVTLSITRNRAQRTRPHLDRAVVDEEVSAMRYRIEVKAAALMHDTVLNHLAAVAHAEAGPMRHELKRQIERDLEILIGEEWLTDPAPELDTPSKSDWRHSALMSAVQYGRDQSLAIDVTGDLAAVGRLTSSRDGAVGLAVRQCLVNVLKHSGIDRAEVVVIGSDHDVSVMVIDAGSGFDETRVASDRLGLRQSVHRRIEAVGGDVKVWSKPGRGTSVMIRVPAVPLVVDEDSEAVTSVES